jgi:hypothetical protein
MEALMIASYFAKGGDQHGQPSNRRYGDPYRIRPSGVLSLLAAISAIGLYAFGLDFAAGV